MNDFRGTGIESTGRFICKEHEGILRKLTGKNYPLFLSSRKIPCDMHHSVGQSDLIDKVRCPVDCLFLRIIDIIKGMKDIFDNPVISIQGKRALEHNSSTAQQASFQHLIFLAPEINIKGC